MLDIIWFGAHHQVCILFGPVPTTNLETHQLRSGNLDIKYAQCAKKIMGVKFHMAFGRHGRPKGTFWAPKNSTFFKSGKIRRVDWN